MAEKQKITTTKEIENLVYTIRGQKVMLDVDLAEIYGYEVRALNQQVKRNINRFPEDFVFQLTKEELPAEFLKSQFVILNNSGDKRGLHIKKMPYAFTEQGIYMLATVLRGELAEQQSIFIMRAFKEMRHYIQNNQNFITQDEWELLTSQTNEILEKQIKVEEKIKSIEKISDQNKQDILKLSKNFITKSDIKEYAIMDGHKFDADEAYITIYSRAKESIYVIDNYVSIKTLSLLSKKSEGVNVVLFTDNKCNNNTKIKSFEVTDFNEQCPHLIVKPNNIYHDRYIIIDYNTENEQIYHCGSSSKDAGKTGCTISKLNDTSVYHDKIEQLLASDVLELD